MVVPSAQGTNLLARERADRAESSFNIPFPALLIYSSCEEVRYDCPVVGAILLHKVA